MELTRVSKRAIKAILAVALILALVAVGRMWINGIRHSPRYAASRYLKAWRSGDEQARRELTTPDSYAIEERLTQIVGQMPRAVSYRVGKATVSGDRAIVHVKGWLSWQTAEAGGLPVAFSVDMVLVRRDGVWLVDSMATLRNLAKDLGSPAEILQRLIDMISGSGNEGPE